MPDPQSFLANDLTFGVITCDKLTSLPALSLELVEN